MVFLVEGRAVEQSILGYVGLVANAVVFRSRSDVHRCRFPLDNTFRNIGAKCLVLSKNKNKNIKKAFLNSCFSVKSTWCSSMLIGLYK